MNYELLIKIIEVVVLIICTIIARYIIPWIKTKVNVEKITLVATWASIFVKAAEQIISGKGLGEEKKAQVVEWLQAKISELGITISDDDLNNLIESAVNTLNSSTDEA